MERRDLIKDQIEQLGRVLAKIMSDFLGLKAKGNAVGGIEISNKQLKSELDMDIEKLVTLNKIALKDYIIEKQISEMNIEILSDYFTEIGIVKASTNNDQHQRYFEKAIMLLDIADEISKTMSLTRTDKKNKIESYFN